MDVAEEQRAATYRAQQTSRARAQAARCAALAGPPAARAALTANWSAIELASLDVDFDLVSLLEDGCGPLGPQTN